MKLRSAKATLTPTGWRTVPDLREEYRFPSNDAVYKWLKRQRIANVRRGKIILVHYLDVEAALRKVHIRGIA